jgi:uncharacterized protein
MHPRSEGPVTTKFPLRLLPGELAVCRLDPTVPTPAWAEGAPFSCIMRTEEELSIVCAASNVPAGVRHEAGWSAFQLVGPVPFTTTGVVAGLTVPLANAGVGVFILSTFDTDYLLVKQGVLLRAIQALRDAGHDVRD